MERGTYLYAVLPKASVPGDLAQISGVEDGRVYSVTTGELAAVVSDVPTREEMRPERRLLAAHQGVLRHVTDSSRVVLPVSFGTVAEGADSVRELLERYQKDLSEQMLRVEGKREMGVRVTYEAARPSVFDFLVANNAELREARDAIAGREATRDEKINLGQKVEAALDSLREEYSRRAEGAIGDLAESKRNPPHSEREFVNLAFLVPISRQADFDVAVQSAAKLFPDSFSVREMGPYPPYDFVDLHVTSLQGDA